MKVEDYKVISIKEACELLAKATKPIECEMSPSVLNEWRKEELAGVLLFSNPLFIAKAKGLCNPTVYPACRIKKETKGE